MENIAAEQQSTKKKHANDILIPIHSASSAISRDKGILGKLNTQHSKCFSKNTFISCCNKQITAVAEGQKKPNQQQ